MAKYYWTYKLYDEAYDGEFDTSQECIDALDAAYAEELEEHNMQNGERFTTDAEIIRFYYDEDNERKVAYTQQIQAVYEHYHGDYIEHGAY